jgi:predicted metal-binding membrane protein
VSSAPDLTSRLLRHDRLLVAGGLVLLITLSWAYLATGAGMADAMQMDGMAPPPLLALVLMWWIMMAAMMLPSAAPTILLYARVRAQRGSEGIAAPWLFLVGYLLIWLVFSVSAAAVQRAVAGPAMTIVDARAAGLLLVAVGIYQLTPLKSACLRQCQSPAAFLSRYWRAGPVGALRLGVIHGAYCVGCCWLLMALLFVGGVMNFAWIAAIAVIVGMEKLAPHGEWLGRAAGIGLVLWGAARLLA